MKSKFAAGEYASESEVIRDGLRALLARDRAVENWLQERVGPAYDALKADPTRAVSIDDVRARLAAEHEESWRGSLAFADPVAVNRLRDRLRVSGGGIDRIGFAGSGCFEELAVQGEV